MLRLATSTLLATKETCLKWQAARMAGSWFENVGLCLRSLHRRSFAEALRMSRWLPQLPDGEASWVMQEQEVWTLAWNLNVELAAARPGAVHTSTCPAIRNSFFGRTLWGFAQVMVAEHALLPDAARLLRHLQHRARGQAVCHELPENRV